jgi:hypothetical protein
METLPLPTDVKVWAEAQVAAGRASSIEALAAEALATVKAQQEGIAADQAITRVDGRIEYPDAVTALRAWLADEER